MITVNINGKTYKLVPTMEPRKITCSLCDLEHKCPTEHNICEAFRLINKNWYQCYFKRNIKL